MDTSTNQGLHMPRILPDSSVVREVHNRQKELRRLQGEGAEVNEGFLGEPETVQ
jgi:hypothetical protein